jgi:hypothetical protein
VDRRKGSPRLVLHKLSEEERQLILLTCNQAEYASLPPGGSCQPLPTRGSLSVLRAAFIECSMPADRSTGAVEHGHHRSRVQYRGSVRQVRIRCGVGTSPTCPPPFEGSGCISTW